MKMQNDNSNDGGIGQRIWLVKYMPQCQNRRNNTVYAKQQLF